MEPHSHQAGACMYELRTDDDVRAFAEEHGHCLKDRGPGEVFVLLPGPPPAPNAMAGDTVIDKGPEAFYRYEVYSTEGLQIWGL